MISATEALGRLQSGNQRFVDGVQTFEAFKHEVRGPMLSQGQEPFAIVLGCSDSRVPAEIVFDQGLGDLFVIRVAGNIVAPSQIGSVEYAVEKFETRLVVVLGHTKCGAVTATLDELTKPAETRSRNLSSIVDRIRPSVESVAGTGVAQDRDHIIEQAIRANIRVSADHLRHGSAILEQYVRERELLIIGAEYSLDSGKVNFFSAG